MVKDQNYHVDAVKKAALDKELVKITLSFIDTAEVEKTKAMD